mmetsp:Transcript_28230/g.79682  ORF Transcript_28230/g.79682 Transcript_28230/m.79682 type:complete len:83 (-) Transcript_28230:50-298(-)
MQGDNTDVPMLCHGKGNFTEEEDNRLVMLQQVHENSWQKIAVLLSKDFGRDKTGKQCRERFLNHVCTSIAPSLSLSRQRSSR